MRTCTIALLVAGIAAAGLMTAERATAQNQQSEADKGVKTRNSGESGYVGDQNNPGAAATPPGRPAAANNAAGASNAPSAQSSGTGISGAPGNKNGPAPGQSTVGSSPQNERVQQQDPSNVQGLPGNKSGPPAKR
ncbi:hypothetical protein BraRD5C2_35720 [Bradyrhizobium sp. RD5-C2]|nr:hypothetical protein BraRD5C2_35720 [Bradyrhizobium sp. RD5-C2]